MWRGNMRRRRRDMDGQSIDVATESCGGEFRRRRRIMWWSRGCGWLC
jgi:hypothetical protein